MDKRPEALRLADEIDRMIEGGWSTHCEKKAAAELRRLHEVNQELLKALNEAADDLEHWGCYVSDYFQKKHDLHDDIARVRAVIAKAGETK